LASVVGIETFASAEACIAAVGIVEDAIVVEVRMGYAASNMVGDSSYMVVGESETAARERTSGSLGVDGRGERRESGHVVGQAGHLACGSS
jgi:hypothetical protein